MLKIINKWLINNWEFWAVMIFCFMMFAIASNMDYQDEVESENNGKVEVYRGLDYGQN